MQQIPKTINSLTPDVRPFLDEGDMIFIGFDTGLGYDQSYYYRLTEDGKFEEAPRNNELKRRKRGIQIRDWKQQEFTNPHSHRRNVGK